MKKTNFIALAFMVVVFGTIMLAEPASASPSYRERVYCEMVDRGSICQSNYFKRCCHDPGCNHPGMPVTDPYRPYMNCCPYCAGASDNVWGR